MTSSSIFKLRSELQSLSHSIQNSSWQGENEISLNKDSPIPISKLFETLTTSIGAYETVEKSLQGRIETTQNLSLSLKQLCVKVHAQKPWYKRILSYFGFFQTQGEKELIRTAKKIEGIVSQWQTQLTHLYPVKEKNVIERACREYVEVTHQSLKQQVKECAFRTLRDLNPKEQDLTIKDDLGGSFPIYSFKSLEADLDLFLKTHYSDLSPKQRDQIEQILNTIRSCAKLTSELTSIRIWFLSVDSPKKHEELRARLADLTFKLGQSIEKLKVGQTTIISGGYSSTEGGHGVIYGIQRMSEKEFYFAIFNTGEGADLGLSFGFDDLINLISKGRVRIPVYTNLPLETISNPDFLSDLLAPSILESSDNSMKTIYEVVNRYLIPHGKQETSHDVISLQTWGTCAFDSVLSFIQTELSPGFFSSFHLFIMQKARKKLDTVLPQALKENTFRKETIELIDRKSRQTLASYGKNYRQYFEKSSEHILANKLIAIEKISSEEELSLYLSNKKKRLESIHQILEKMGWFDRLNGKNRPLIDEKNDLTEELAAFSKVAQKSTNVLEYLQLKKKETRLFNKIYN